MRVFCLIVLCFSFHGCATQVQLDNPITDMSVIQLQDAINREDVTAVQVTQAFLDRIAKLDDAGPRLNAIIEVNPDALMIAQRLDKAMANQGPVGPLHGIPVVLKANIDTGDKMATSAGSLALANHRATQDAFHVARLREAGAVILAKANLSEWANFRSESSVSGWSSLGGQTKNPYATDRNPCGSSSGSAVAVSATLAPLAVGTETDGSVVCPAGINGIVGIKPTIGLVSRSGIIPIAHSQDTAGPMANSVTDAALLLDAMVGKDDADPASVNVSFPKSYLPDPDRLDLNAVRVGVWRNYFGSNLPRVAALLEENIASLKNLGADIVDPIEIDMPDKLGDAEYQVLLYEFKADLNTYLASHKVDDGVNTLLGLIEFNRAHSDQVMPIFKQEIFLQAQEKTSLGSEEYKQALADSQIKLRKIIDNVLENGNLDVLIAPVNSPSWKTDWVNGDNFLLSSSRLAAVSGYASVAVPAGFIDGLPVGIAFIGGAFKEKDLIQYAYAFEQSTMARRKPEFLPRIRLEEKE